MGNIPENRRVIIVRHGQTEMNIKGRAQGWSDSPLTRTGMLQTMALSRYLRNLGFSFPVIYTSDLGRAVQTAGILAEPDSKVFGVPGLREITFGDLDGRDTRAFEGVDWSTDYEKHGGESDEQAVLRGWRALMEICAKEIQENPESTDPVLIVSHGAILMGMYLLLDKSADQNWPEDPVMHNCQALICELDTQSGRLVLQETWYPNL